MLTASKQTRGTLQRATVVLLFVLISAIFIRLIWGLLLAVVVAAISAGLTYPLYTRLLRFFRGRKATAAAATLIVVLLLVVAPLALFSQVVATEAVQISRSVRPEVTELLHKFEEPGTPLDETPEFFAKRNRASIGLGYVINKNWTVDLRYQRQRSRSTIEEEFETSSNVIDFKIKSSFRIRDLVKGR